MAKESAAREETGLRRLRPYPEYKDSGVEWLGRIPAQWEVKPLKRVFSISNGATPKSEVPAYWDGDIPWATPEDLGKSTSRVLAKTARCISQSGYQSCGTKLAPAGSLVLSTRAPIGHLAIADMPLCTNQGCRTLVFRHDDGRPYFYYQVYSSRPLLEGFGRGSTFKELSAEDLGVIPLCVPDRHEQETVAAFLDREAAKIDALVAKKERLIELLQEKRTALITQVVTKGLDPNVPLKDSRIEWLGEIPARWDVSRIKNISSFVTSGSRGWAEFYADEGPVFLRIGNLQAGSIELNTDDVQHVDPPRGAEAERIRASAGDLLVSITALIGAVAVVPNGLLLAYVNQHIALVRLSDRNANARYIGYCILSSMCQAQFASSLYGGTKDGLNLDDVRSLFVLLPPIEEQEQIVEFLDAHQAKTRKAIEMIRNAVSLLKEYRSALISAAVTGKIDVRGEVP